MSVVVDPSKNKEKHFFSIPKNECPDQFFQCGVEKNLSYIKSNNQSLLHWQSPLLQCAASQLAMTKGTCHV